MTRTRVAYAVRTLAGPWAFVIALGIAAFTALQRHQPYLGEAMWTVRWMALDLWMLWILACAFAAVDAALLMRPGRRAFVFTAASGRRLLIWSALWTGIPVAIAQICVTVVALAAGRAEISRVGWLLLCGAIVSQASTIVWASALGSLIGRLCPPVVAGIVAAAVAFAAGYALTTANLGSSRFTFLGDTGASVSQIGVRWNGMQLLIQIGLLLGTAALLVAVRPRIWRGQVIPGAALVASVAVAVACVVIVPPRIHGDPLRDDLAKPSRCTGQLPTICIYSEHSRDAGPTLTLIRNLMGAAQRQGYSGLVLQRVDEQSRRYVGNAADGIGSFPSIEHGSRTDAGLMIQTLYTPYWCPVSAAGPPERFNEDIGDLLATTNHLVPGMTANYVSPDDKVLSASQTNALIAAWRRCNLSFRA